MVSDVALINLESSLKRVVERLKKISSGQGIEILSYKRNRGIVIIKMDEDRFLMTERGYIEQEREIEGSALVRQLKSAMKREFPRSRKVRIYNISAHTSPGAKRKRL